VELITVFLLLFQPLFVSAQFSDPSPLPEIRKQRIANLLPSALFAAKVDAWLVICRENNNDPLASHVGCENAGQTVFNDGCLLYASDLWSIRSQPTCLPKHF
jgi:hypothetical protein